MSIVAETYQTAGLKGIVELYSLFPARLRQQIITSQATLFRSLWKELTPSEKLAIDQYALVNETADHSTTAEYYRNKLQDLELNYSSRRAQRIRDLQDLDPEVCTALLLDYDKAHTTLTQITQELLTNAIEREDEQRQRRDEALLFEPSETELTQICIVP